MQISRSSVITIQAPINIVFPLFGPIEERKWADGWDPIVIHPVEGHFEEGMVFKTRATNKQEDWYYWVLSCWWEFVIIQYQIHSANRVWTIFIECQSTTKTSSTMKITYNYTGLNEIGDLLNNEALNEMFTSNLKDWEQSLNHFIKTGKCLKSSKNKK